MESETKRVVKWKTPRKRGEGERGKVKGEIVDAATAKYTAIDGRTDDKTIGVVKCSVV